MYQTEECISGYQRLLRLLEEDSEQIANGLQGELLEAYRDVLVREKNVLTKAIQAMQNTH